MFEYGEVVGAESGPEFLEDLSVLIAGVLGRYCSGAAGCSTAGTRTLSTSSAAPVYNYGLDIMESWAVEVGMR